MRIRVGLLAGTALVLASALPAPAQAAGTEPVGGARLGTRGLVVAAGATRPPTVSAAGWLVADMTTGEVLAAKDAHGRYAPASTLKVLTAATVIDQLDPAQLVQPTFADVNVEGSRVGIVTKMRYSVKDLLTAMLVVSGNDAANALATANGGLRKTVGEMNAEARRLQALDTHAENTNGLDHPRQLSSPYDLALIGRAAMQSPEFRRYVATKRYDFPAPGGKTIYLGTHDKLLWNYDGAIGIKNGYTTKARATFVGAATRGGRTLIVTLMKNNPRYWPEAAALLNWGFANSKRALTPVGTLVDPVVEDGGAVSVTAGTAKAPLLLPGASRRTASGVPVVPTLLVGSGIAVLGGGVLRNRQLSRRRRRRAALQP